MPSLDLGDESTGDGSTTPTPDAAKRPPAAVLLDGATRRHVLNPDGSYKEVHPVDSWVEHQLLVEFRKLAASPSQGQRLREIKNPYDQRAEQTANDHVRAALADGIRRKDLTIERIVYEPHPFGGMRVAVEYFNERLTPRVKRTAFDR